MKSLELSNPFTITKKPLNPDVAGAVDLLIDKETGEEVREALKGTAAVEPTPADVFDFDPTDDFISVEQKAEITAIKEAKEVKKFFGENFFGQKQIESAFTIKNEQGQDIKLVDLSPAERQQAEQMLIKKLQEPDIKTFLSKQENQQDIKDGKYLLILRVNTIKVNGQDIPLTIKTMNDLIAPDMMNKGQGKLLFNTRTESFYTTTIPTFEWTIVTKDVVKRTLGEKHSDQTTKLQEEAKRIGLDSTKIKRRQLVQTVYDHMVSLRTINQRLLINRYDWSDENSSPGYLAYVGGGDSSGLRLHDRTPDGSNGSLGASLSR